MTSSLQDVEKGEFYKILNSPLARKILGHDQIINEDASWVEFTTQQLRQTSPWKDLLAVGLAAFGAFLQSNVTGPPLEWRPRDVLISQRFQRIPREEFQRQLVASLIVDGEAAYHLTPNVELFCLARCVILNFPEGHVQEANLLQWSRVRINFWHQRMLGENAACLQKSIYEDLDDLEKSILASGPEAYSKTAQAQFLLERAVIHTHHGFDVKARQDIASAAKETGFEFALTGRLGKRTKFQQKELSQLVVLAKSADICEAGDISSSNRALDGHLDEDSSSLASKPANLDLNDDTLLESVSFSKDSASTPAIQDEESLPPSLASLDPGHQPLLKPLDSIILLALASSITNTSPQHGLTREETLPYATRVLEGGSTNWQVYTQALLVRSRIEGYRSRTIERGVLQLQALVDQIIAETTSTSTQSSSDTNGGDSSASTTFLPRPKPSESATVSERLEYIHQLASPTRWTLEAELAARWVSLGGLRTALEIYEQLEMWAEAALCWAAVEREDKARRIVRCQLYHVKATKSVARPFKVLSMDDEDVDIEEYLGAELDQLPADAPRLFCILGDLDKDPLYYERAWLVSNRRYARAQRSLGKYYLSYHEFAKADQAYSASLAINPLNHSTWFALGCVRLETRNWQGAVDAFTRTVQLESEDAEAWSNLAAALLRLPPSTEATVTLPEDINSPTSHRLDTNSNSHSAFTALKRAAALNRNSYRIWQNLLNVSASLSPPPSTDIIIAQTRLIELRGAVEGEKCIDTEILKGLISHIISSPPSSDLESKDTTQSHGLEKMVLTLVREKIQPLITTSRPLYLLLAKLELHLKHPAAALEMYEKAWRVALNKPGWENGDEEGWREVVDATGELVGAYEGLGALLKERNVPEENEEGRKEGELVCREWKFKARSAINGVLGRGRECWAEDDGYQRLKDRMAGLRTRDADAG